MFYLGYRKLNLLYLGNLKGTNSPTLLGSTVPMPFIVDKTLLPAGISE